MIDLRSDTVTKPTAEMRAAMAAAEVGDDGYGDDPTVRALEEKAAVLVGKDAALFMPSGTMGNLAAVLAQTERGDEVVVESAAHVYRSELGGASVVGSVSMRVMPSERGMLSIDELKASISGTGGYIGRQRTSLICVETTHNASGGTVPPISYLIAVRDVAESVGASVHMDGARIFNAAAALSIDASDIARYADSVMFCLSKGLGAPVGSMLCGTSATIEKARLVRKMLGGTMRQAGVLAAAGIVALDTMVERLTLDHQGAQRLAEGLRAIDGGLCEPTAVETNILFADFKASGRSAAQWCEILGRHGIVCRPYSASRIRMLTHADVSDTDIDKVISAVKSEW